MLFNLLSPSPQRLALLDNGLTTKITIFYVVRNYIMFEVANCDLGNKEGNMADNIADNIEHPDKGELVANCDRLHSSEVVDATPVESRIISIRGSQIMIDRDLAELYGVETKKYRSIYQGLGKEVVGFLKDGYTDTR